MIKPLNPQMIEHLHSLALEDLARKRNMSDGTWNNLIGGSDSAFIVNYIDDVTKAYRSHQAKHALTYRPQTGERGKMLRPVPLQPRAELGSSADTYSQKENSLDTRSGNSTSEPTGLPDAGSCPSDFSSSPLPSVQGRSYDRPFPFQPSGEFGNQDKKPTRWYLQL